MAEKEKFLAKLRQRYSKRPERGHSLSKKLDLKTCVAQLDDSGAFEDLKTAEEEIRRRRLDQSRGTANQVVVSDLVKEAFGRLWKIGEGLQHNRIAKTKRELMKARVYRGVLRYGGLETGRANVSGGRFHPSCFLIPTCAINIYFCLFDDMQAVESGRNEDALTVDANAMLKQVGFQSWTQPYRNDETDDNVVQVDRFRKHVWWVGGNALAYRSVFACAAMMNSVPMMDVLAEVAKGAISAVSQTTYDEAFWTEGMTADGAGWGHGMQCLIWGYPIHGTQSALKILTNLKGSPWAQKLERKNVDALMTLIRGSSWFYYNGFVPPCLGRANMRFERVHPRSIPSLGLAEAVYDSWRGSLSVAERKELKQFIETADRNRIVMPDLPGGYYSGTRYFFNNDNLIKKADDHYAFVSMASRRCDGIESAPSMAAGYNFYTCDGMTLFSRRGDEYNHAIGAWNMTAIPGVTNRQGAHRLTPVTNWRGYCSKHNFAAGASRGSEHASGGFIYEKMNASWKKDVNDGAGRVRKNEVLYGVKAYKSWFFLGDVMVALGAGIRNFDPEQPGDVWTTIDQTVLRDSVRWQTASSSGRAAINKKQSVLLKKRNAQDASLPWVAQDGGFAYAVLPEHTPGQVRLLTERRKTQWDKIDIQNRDVEGKTDAYDMLQVWINHGRQVENDTYAYVVYAGDDDPKNVFATSPVRVLHNTTRLQAASRLDGQVVGGVFYHSGSVLDTGDWQLKVSAPCAVLVEMEGNTCHITVTDARMDVDLSAIQVRTSLPIDGDGVRVEGKWRLVDVALPVEPFRGKPASVAFDLMP